ncbi:hypothetical protein [Sediminibacterium sp.]|uniref:hypothetical protein n=1 Tax=Sediminibacterium sp. TaxID=1917865 RepID=UPI003F701375
MGWFFCYTTNLIERGSMVIDNRGEIARTPKTIITFHNSETLQYIKVDDVVLAKQRRNRRFLKFLKTYKNAFKKKDISVLLSVVDIDAYPSPKAYVDLLKDRCKAKSIDIHGYIWLRDIGDKEFKRHYHFIIVTSRIKNSLSSTLFEKLNTKDADHIFCNNLKASVEYLIAKEMYSPLKSRSYGSSRSFIIPK